MRNGGWRSILILVVTLFTAGLSGCGGGGKEQTGDAPRTVARAYSDFPGTDMDWEQGVEVTWTTPKRIPERNILEYHILRGEDLVGVTAPSSRAYRNRFELQTGTYIYRIPDAQGALITGTGTAPKGEIGKAYRYRVRAIYQVNGQKYSTFLLPESGPVTPIREPSPVAPYDSAQILERVRIPFYGVAGANQYIYEFSTDSRFTKKVTRGPFAFTSNSQEAPNPQTLDMSKEFKDIPEGTEIYFRIGARNAQDEAAPVSPRSANGANYIYSLEGAYFRKYAPIPPPAPL